jgi:hypothetical protein
MSTIREKCERLVFTNTEFLLYNVLPFLAGLIAIRAVVHELAHGLMNGLLGGTFGFTIQRSGACMRGYCLERIFIVEPVLSVWYEVPVQGNIQRVLMLLAGPWSIILLGWIVAHYWNPVTLDAETTCVGRNKWKRVRGFVIGTTLAAWFDAIYLMIDPFPGGWGGDGMALIRLFREMDLVYRTRIDGALYTLNPEYIIGFIAALGTLYYSLLVLGIDVRGIPSRILGCSYPSSRRCEI